MDRFEFFKDLAADQGWVLTNFRTSDTGIVANFMNNIVFGVGVHPGWSLPNIGQELRVWLPSETPCIIMIGDSRRGLDIPPYEPFMKDFDLREPDSIEKLTVWLGPTINDTPIMIVASKITCWLKKVFYG